MTIQVRLPAHARRALALGGVSIAVAPSGASLALQISNPANKLVNSTTGDLTVSQGGTPLFSQSLELAAFVPKSAITYHVPWEGVPVEGSYRVRGELRPVGAEVIRFDRMVRFGRRAIDKYRRQTGRPAKTSSSFPVVLAAALALALALAVAFAVAYVQARKQLRERR